MQARSNVRIEEDSFNRPGSAGLAMPKGQGEDMHLIAALRVGRGYRLGMAYSVTDLRILKNCASTGAPA